MTLRRRTKPQDPTIIRVEMQASGHIDYVLKYAIGCADLALDQGGWRG